MTQGIFINDHRPASKKEVKEAVMEGKFVRIEATSIFGNEFDGLVTDMPENKIHYFVGPDPAYNRKFYGQIIRNGDKVTVK